MANGQNNGSVPFALSIYSLYSLYSFYSLYSLYCFYSIYKTLINLLTNTKDETNQKTINIVIVPFRAHFVPA